jgi:hypothetical protein
MGAHLLTTGEKTLRVSRKALREVDARPWAVDVDFNHTTREYEISIREVKR